VASVAPGGDGMVRFLDRSVSPGVGYGYRLSYLVDGVAAHTGETRVTVPALARFALAGATPNPSPRGRLLVSFSLPGARPARLSLFDITGRQVAARDVGSLGAGEHVLDPWPKLGLSAGMYWVRLAQDDLRAAVRVVITD